MDKTIEEGLIKGSIDIISLDKVKIILKQMKKCICKINGKKRGTGFFCKINYKHELISALITNYHIIDEEYIEKNNLITLYINEEARIINVNKNNIIYSSDNNQYDIIIINLKKEKINNYLEIDDNIYIDNSELLYKENSIYLLHYPSNGKASISYGYGIEKMNEFNIMHICNTESCSSGGPIINLSTNKVIGIHKGRILEDNKIQYNAGIFLKYPLNEIHMLKIEKSINKNIRELLNLKNKKEKKIINILK